MVLCMGKEGQHGVLCGPLLGLEISEEFGLFVV